MSRPAARRSAPIIVTIHTKNDATATHQASGPFQANGPVLTAHLIAVAAGWAYDLRLKATRASVLTYVVAMGLSLLFVVYGLPGSPRPPWWLPVVTILLGCGTHFANVLRDLDDDLAIGVRGLPQRLGAPVSRTIAVVLTFGALVLLVVVAPLQPAVSVIALIAAVAVLALGFGTVREVGSERPFRAVAVVGLLTVGLLISVGPALH